MQEFSQYKNTPYIIYTDGKCFSLLSRKFLKPKTSVTYPTYHLAIDGKPKTVKIHRMVAETFLPQPFGKTIVNHIDGDTHNYTLTNLEWVTAKENSQHAINTGLKKSGDQKINKYITNLKEEKWKEIEEYPNYLISNYGRIMNIRTKRLLKPYADNCGGYLCVSLWKNNRGTTKRVHQLVYAIFYKDDNLKGYVINHIDGNKKNNYYLNLEKITYKENNLHAVYQIGTNKSAKPILQLDDNRNIIKEYPSIAAAERQLKISCIGRAARKGGRAGGYYWEFK